MYQHICHGNNTAPGAPIHSVIGMAGMGASLDVRLLAQTHAEKHKHLHSPHYTQSAAHSSPLQIVFPRPAYSIARFIDEYGYSKIQVANATHLHMQFMSNAGIVQDDFWIVNQNHLTYLK